VAIGERVALGGVVAVLVATCGCAGKASSRSASDGGVFDSAHSDAAGDSGRRADGSSHGDSGQPVDAASADARGVVGDGGVSDAAVDAYRNLVDQPFTSTSVWNLPIGSGAAWESATEPATAQLVGASTLSILAANYGKQFWVGGASDRAIQVIDTDVTPAFEVPPESVHVPFSSLPLSQQIRWPTFFDLSVSGHPLLYSYYGDVPDSSPPGCLLADDAGAISGMSCTLAGVADPCGDGIAMIHGASRYDFAIGTIRHADLVAQSITHSLRYAVSLDLAMSLERVDGGSPGNAWLDAVWPDDNEDYWGPVQGHLGSYRGHIPFGSTIGIPAATDLSALGLSPGGMVLARALQTHGAIMRDTTGSFDPNVSANELAFYAEPQDETNPLLVAMRSELAKIVPALRVLKNQGPSSINGGGTPTAPLVPPLAPDVCP
jgi:hypothetical protein